MIHPMNAKPSNATKNNKNKHEENVEGEETEGSCDSSNSDVSIPDVEGDPNNTNVPLKPRPKPNDTIDEYLHHILGLIQRPETPKPVSVKPRVRRKIEEGSYPNWTIGNENDLPKILRYTWKGKVKKLKNLLAKNSSGDKIKIVDSSKRTALHYAASWACPKCVSLLLAVKNVNVNAQDEYGKTPLFKALEVGGGKDGLKVTELLLKKGADVTLPCNDSRDVFVFTVHEFGDERIEHLRLLYERDEKLRKYYNTEPYSMPILNIAISAREKVRIKEIVEMLVEGGANVNAIEGAGRSPIMIAAMLGRTKILKYLLNHGANVDAVDATKKSVRDYVIPGSKCEKAILNFIAASGRALDLYKRSDRDGITPVESDALRKKFFAYR